jgi:hypothetical protein
MLRLDCIPPLIVFSFNAVDPCLIPCPPNRIHDFMILRFTLEALCLPCVRTRYFCFFHLFLNESCSFLLSAFTENNHVIVPVPIYLCLDNSYIPIATDVADVAVVGLIKIYEDLDSHYTF